MNWSDDPYKEIKYEIFDFLVQRLSLEKGTTITMKMLMDSIDQLFKNLIHENGEDE